MGATIRGKFTFFNVLINFNTFLHFRDLDLVSKIDQNCLKNNSFIQRVLVFLEFMLAQYLQT